MRKGIINPDLHTLKNAEEIARAVLSAVEGWRDIESAPKDGTPMDLWVSWGGGRGHRVPDAYWTTEGFNYGPGRHALEPGWAAANMGYDGADGWADTPAEGVAATHWRPLPDPPGEG